MRWYVRCFDTTDGHVHPVYQNGREQNPVGRLPQLHPDVLPQQHHRPQQQRVRCGTVPIRRSFQPSRSCRPSQRLMLLTNVTSSTRVRQTRPPESRRR